MIGERGLQAGAAVALTAALLLAGARPLGALPPNCRSGDLAAASLLFPYFEVDLDGGRTTLIAITNQSPVAPTLARVTLWTDWAIPTLAFDLFLTAMDVQTLNLRDILLTGRAPRTGPGANEFLGCPGTVGGEEWDADTLRRAHTGRATAAGTCFASPHADPTLATGYITVDVTRRCPGPGVTPATPGYFEEPNRVVADANVLGGDFFQVDPEQNYAGGQNAVHLRVPDAALAVGDYTFYGRYVGFTARDKRLPMSNQWRTRFLTGGGFDGGTHLVIWRDTRDERVEPRVCGEQVPVWLPLGEKKIVVRDEQGSVLVLAETDIFDLATQRVPVSALALPYQFGTLELNLDHRDGTTAQAWVGWDANAQSRFNVSLAGIPIRDPCSMHP